MSADATGATMRWLAAIACAAAATAAHAADAGRGAELYASRCGACHSLDANRVGPLHRGVFGRKAGSVPDYAYSPALERSGVTWNAATLDRWLTDPEAFLPGQRMGYRLDDAGERADVIEYLRQASAAAAR
jgi:cytochrome c